MLARLGGFELLSRLVDDERKHVLHAILIRCRFRASERRSMGGTPQVDDRSSQPMLEG